VIFLCTLSSPLSLEPRLLPFVHDACLRPACVRCHVGEGRADPPIAFY
jgi:hypothetical protein